VTRDFPGNDRRGKEKINEVKLSRFMNSLLDTSQNKAQCLVCGCMLAVGVHPVTWME